MKFTTRSMGESKWSCKGVWKHLYDNLCRLVLEILFLNEEGAVCFRYHYDSEAVGARIDPTAESGVRWYPHFELGAENAAQARSIDFNIIELKTNNIIAEVAEKAVDAAKDVVDKLL